MRVAVDTLDPVADDVLVAVNRVVEERASSPVFASVRDLRLRLANVKGALLCVAVVGLSGGGLATSTATSTNALGAIVGALDGLPERIDRVTRRPGRSPSSSNHAAVRDQLKLLLDRG